MADKATNDDTLIEFPCDFPIKVMGETRDDFAETIVAVIQGHLPDFHAGRIEMRASSGGRYISLTCMVHVTSKPQLDDIYRTLTAHPMVRVVL
jgi:putative lipoic acid-binding regulatory protein